VLAVQLGSGNHGGVTIHLVSSAPDAVLLAPNGTTVGTGTLDIPVADGTTSTYFTVQALEGAAGADVTVTASAQGFVQTSGTGNVVTPALQITNLGGSYSSTATNTDFRVQVGIPYSSNASLLEGQAVRFGAAPLTATITNSAPTVARLVSQTTTGQSLTVSIAGGQQYSASTQANGGVQFDPLAAPAVPR
jgi:hypothetical protein